MNRKPFRPAPLGAVALLAVMLAACGGAAPDDDGAAATAEDRARPLAAAAPTRVTPPLLDDQGRPAAAVPEAVPADPAARTHHRRYATAAQAAMLEARFGVLAIPVSVDPGPDAAAALDLALQMVWGHQAVHDQSTDAPVLVRGPDLRLAAAAVHQLEAIGFTRVFLVTR